MPSLPEPDVGGSQKPDRNARNEKLLYRFARNAQALVFRSASSAVTKVRSYTNAVATRKRSAGSRCEGKISRLRTATSKFSVASCTGVLLRASTTHARGSLSSLTLPRSASAKVSQTLIGESQSPFSARFTAARTRRLNFDGSTRLQTQIWVSRSSLTLKPSTRRLQPLARRYPPPLERGPPCCRATLPLASLAKAGLTPRRAHRSGLSG